MPRLLAAGWELERAAPAGVVGRRRPTSARCRSSSTRSTCRGSPRRYAEVVYKVRDLGVALSDRRAVKVLKLVAASAVLCGRRTAAISRPLGAPVRLGPRGADRPAGRPDRRRDLGRTRDEPGGPPAPAAPGRVDGEELARQLEAAEAELNGSGALEPRRRRPAPRARRRPGRPRRLGRRRPGAGPPEGADGPAPAVAWGDSFGSGDQPPGRQGMKGGEERRVRSGKSSWIILILLLASLASWRLISL